METGSSNNILRRLTSLTLSTMLTKSLLCVRHKGCLSVTKIIHLHHHPLITESKNTGNKYQMVAKGNGEKENSSSSCYNRNRRLGSHHATWGRQRWADKRRSGRHWKGRKHIFRTPEGECCRQRQQLVQRAWGRRVCQWAVPHGPCSLSYHFSYVLLLNSVGNIFFSLHW
jgi:hypothetical protein